MSTRISLSFYVFSNIVVGTMRIPFSLNLRVGTDIVVAKRVFDHTAPNSERLKRFCRRLLHRAELAELTLRYPWWQQSETRDSADNQNLSQFLAGRWAAKEAAKKAWGASQISWKNVRVERQQATGQLGIICTVSPVTEKAETKEQEGLLSISHDGDYAVATVIAAPLDSAIAGELLKTRSGPKIKKYIVKDPNQETPQ